MTLLRIVLFLWYIKQVDSMLPCGCSVIDHRRCQNVVRTSVTRLMATVPPCLFLPYVVIICDLLLTKCTATWNLFVKQSYNYSLRQKRKGNYIVSYVLFTRSILDREEMKT